MNKISLLIISGILISASVFFVFNQRNQFTDLSQIKTEIRNKFPGVKQISTASYRQDQPQAIILDVREAEEFNTSHLSNAKLSTNINQALDILKDVNKDTPIIAYCSVGYRSSALVEKLNDLGYTNVVNLEGSIFEWANEGYPVFNEQGKTEEVHPYDSKWGKLLDKVYHPKE